MTSMGVFRSRPGSAAYLAAALLVVAGLILLVSQPDAWCSAPRGTPGVTCRPPSSGHNLGFVLAGIGWVSMLVTANAMADRFRGRWTALFSVCLGLVIPDAIRTLIRAEQPML